MTTQKETYKGYQLIVSAFTGKCRVRKNDKYVNTFDSIYSAQYVIDNGLI